MRIFLIAILALISSPSTQDYPTLIAEARTCFETGRHEECDALLAELRGMKLKRLQRRKVCTLWLDNTYHTGRHEAFLEALGSKYVKQNLDRTDYDYWRKVSLLPPMEVVWPQEPELLPLKTIDPQGKSLYGIDVMVNGKPLVGMIDNCCCNYCSISTELAEQLGVRPIGKTIRYNGNRQAKAYIGIVDSLVIGGLVVKNVLFDVSDNIETVQAVFPLDIIIGGNVLRRVGDMIIDNVNGTVAFSNKTLDLPRNLVWTYVNHDYYIDGTLDGNAVSLLFDTGSNDTHLNKKYYERFPSDSTYADATVTTVMMDRSWTTKAYLIEEAHFNMCGKDFILNDVTIRLEDYGNSRGDGSLGVDALRQFKSIVFNAGKLYLQLTL